MANTHKGKSLSFLYLLFILAAVVNYSTSSSVPIQQDHENHKPRPNPLHEEEPEIGSTESYNSPEILLHKLEDLVKNLSEIVTRLETRLSETATLVSPQIKYDDKTPVVRVEEEGKTRELERGSAVSVTKYSPVWSERFQFVAAVKLDSDATCVNVLPFRDFEGLSRYVAVGDDRGRVYVFSRNGDVLIQFNTLSGSPVTSMVSYLSVYKNESVVVTGHHNGVVLVHKIYEGLNGEEWGSLSMENIGKFVPGDNWGEGLPITILEVHHVGRSRYILSSDIGGRIQVFRENGTVHGSAVPVSRPVAFLKQRLLFLTETGAGSLDLRSMKIRESECEGLNHSIVRNYVFDAAERSKAYGFTSEGDLIHVLLLGDILNFKCRVRSKRKFDMEEPISMQAIKGYLLLVNEEKVFAYNVSSQHYVRSGGPRLLFSVGFDEIISAFLNRHQIDAFTEKRRPVIPLIASDREKLVVLGLGSGYIGMYRSNLPVFKGEFSTMLWTSPVLFFILFLFGAWQLFAKKKEALTSWGPDDPFSSTPGPTGAPLGSSSGDRAFADSSLRRDDVMDLRGGGGLRGPSRRYVSPSGYPGGATGPYRPSSNDANSRPNPVDPNYRTSSELKYRGPSMESSGFPKIRENIFASNQGVDDSS